MKPELEERRQRILELIERGLDEPGIRAELGISGPTFYYSLVAFDLMSAFKERGGKSRGGEMKASEQTPEHSDTDQPIPPDPSPETSDTPARITPAQPGEIEPPLVVPPIKPHSHGSTSRERLEELLNRGLDDSGMCQELDIRPGTLYQYLVNENLLKRFRELHPESQLRRGVSRTGIDAGPSEDTSQHPGGSTTPPRGRPITLNTLKLELEGMIEEGLTIEEMATRKKKPSPSIRQSIYNQKLLAAYRAKHPQPTISPRGAASDVEKLVDKPLTMQEIGDRVGGKSRQRIEQLLDKYGWRTRWEAAWARKEEMDAAEEAYIAAEEQARSPLYQRIITILNSEAANRASGDPALNATVRYMAQTRCVRLTPTEKFNRIHAALSVYFAAKTSGERISLEEIKRRTGPESPPYSVIGRILHAIGEEPMNGSIEVRRLTPDQTRLFEKALASTARVSYAYRAHLIGIPRYVFSQRAVRKGFKAERVCYYASKKEGMITERRAVDLFEAIDAGYTKEEAMQHANIKTDGAYESIVSQRAAIEGEIERFKREMGIPL